MSSSKKGSVAIIAGYVTMFLVMGTFSLIIGKMLFDTTAEGRGGDVHKFEKPWFSNFVMFLGMTYLLAQFEIKACVNDKKIKQDPSLALTLLNSENRRPEKKVYFAVFWPAFCDFAASFIGFVGLLWLPVSIWQIIRGSILIFTGLMRQFWLKKKLSKREWSALVVVFFSLLLAGVSAVLNGEAEPTPLPTSEAPAEFGFDWLMGGLTDAKPSFTMTIVGILLVLLAQAIQALQTVIEEHLLQGVEAPSTLVVGMEGLWGFLLTCVALAIASAIPARFGEGLHEDFIDSLIMCKNSPTILLLNLLVIVVLLFFNLASMKVTLYTNSVFRNLLEPVRTFLVWGVALVLHKIDESYGEKWGEYSWIQLVALLILSGGMVLFHYKPKNADKVAEVTEHLV